jgi:hypothetical protein
MSKIVVTSLLWIVSAVCNPSAAAVITVDVPGAGATVVTGINDAGDLVGGYFEGGNRAFIYSGGAFQDIVIPGAGQGVFLQGINNLGQVAGYYNSDSGDYHGFITTTAIPEPSSYILLVSGFILLLIWRSMVAPPNASLSGHQLVQTRASKIMHVSLSARIKSIFARDKYAFWYNEITNEEKELARMDVWQLAAVMVNSVETKSNVLQRIVAEHMLNERLARIQSRASIWAAVIGAGITLLSVFFSVWLVKYIS